MDQEKDRLTKRMLPFLMKPPTLLVLALTCILGEVIWIRLAFQNGNQSECLALFAVGLLLGAVGGNWTSRLWDKYYVPALMGRLKLMKTSMGRQSTAFIVLALGIPVMLSFIPASHDPFLPILQSYIFGFIGGMNATVFLWARRLPD